MIRNLGMLVFGLALIGFVPRADAQIIVYVTTLSGPNESPPNASPGTGSSTVTYNVGARTLRIQANFTGLIGNTSAAHIHAATAVPGVGTAGVATQTPSFVGFPLGVTAGTMDQTLDLTLASSYNPSYITANGGTPASAENALMSSIAAGTAYFNVHSSTFGGGEIRGFFAPVPEPGSLALSGFAATAVVGVIRRRRRAAKAA